MRFQCNNCMTVVAIEDTEMGQPVACGNCGKVVIVPNTALAAGAVIGDFVIERHLGRGGLATVYLAHQLSLDRPAALKILHDEYSQDPAFIKNFIHEARAAAQLNHPNIVQAYAVGEEGGTFYFAMEYVQGSTLKNVLSHSGRFVVDQALRITQIIAEALDFAWQQKQLVHRDIKPDNIIITEKQIIKLADLGLARLSEDMFDSSSEEIFGTPQYVAPEQLLGYPADNRTDIYSLGATLFHLVTGTCPYSDDEPAATAKKHIVEPLPSPRSIVADLPLTVCQLIQVMMAKRPGHRYQSAAELVADLSRVRNGLYPERCPLPEFADPINLDKREEEVQAVITPEQEAEAEAIKKRRSLALKVKDFGRTGSAATAAQQTKSRKKLKIKREQSMSGEQQPPHPRNQSPSSAGGPSQTGGSPPGQKPPAAMTGTDDSNRRRLKISDGTAGSHRARSNASARLVAKKRRTRATRGGGTAKSGRKLITILVLAILAGAGGLTYFYYFDRGPGIEPMFDLSIEQTQQLQQLLEGLEELSAADQLRRLRTAMTDFRAKPETTQFLQTMAAPLIEKLTREERAARREQELAAWQQRSQQLITEEEERQARLEEEARQARLEEERQEQERREAELREQRRQSLQEEQQRLRRQTVALSRRHRFHQARIEYAVMAESRERDYREWARNQVRILELAERALQTFRDTDDKLAGMRFVPPDDFRPAQIVSIDSAFISAEFVEPIYEAGEQVGERRQPVTVPIDSLPTRRIIRVIEEAWRYQNGEDENQLNLMLSAYLISRAEMLETAERLLSEAHGEMARRLQEELEELKAIISRQS